MPPRDLRLQDYWERSRSHTYSLILALPLLLGYELSITLVNRLRTDELQVRNLAEMWLLRLGAQVGLSGQSTFFGLLIASAVLIILREWRHDPTLGWRRLEPRIFGLMLLESAAWAWLFGLLVGRATGAILNPFAGLPTGLLPLAAPAAAIGRFEGLALSLGAGLFEELVFRVLLVSGILWLLETSRFTTRGPATLVAVLASALLFSLAHYIGPLGDGIDAASFIFRFLGGLAFSAIYALRGFGIVSWTHALYDLGLYLLR